eukprot:COSAG02_NODE_63054_length_264_cov_0.630303_1_plen_20_part_10
MNQKTENESEKLIDPASRLS